jgi:hypothetical protein
VTATDPRSDDDFDFDFAPEHDGSLSIESAVFQALGAASVCWESLSGTGVFDSDRAKRIGERLLELIGGTADDEQRVVARMGIDKTLRYAGNEWGPLGVAIRASEMTDVGALVRAIRDQPRMGLATTRELLTEVASRMQVTQNSTAGRELGRTCIDAIDNLDSGVLEYATWRPMPEQGTDLAEQGHGPSGAT